VLFADHPSLTVLCLPLHDSNHPRADVHSSYNSINNVPSCANSWMMKTLAREEWSFDG
jgi:hypothetical protein